MFGEVMLARNDKGVWLEVGDKPRVSIAADHGNIVVTSKRWWDNMSNTLTMRNTWFKATTGKLDACNITDSDAKIGRLIVSVPYEEKWLREFTEQLKGGKTEPVYNGFTMKKTSGVWVFEAPGRRIQVGIDEENKEIAVIQSTIQNKESGYESVERVDTKIFNLNCELLSFDSATSHGAIKKIDVKKEESEMNRFLSNPNVKLREEAVGQLEFQRYKET